ncbi:hypothetical protein FZC33_23235 [Labrys sp. KNU-23]|uniref:hypothetical protein n=1 Tax=Labrys sp. KNU-23 TaxID=2789216 RepID=UPI0011EE8BA2|nr:hypothetical protein [Labrys sp. KNU-23]QEN89035.1 hypothetical protein FZC33_23235 [Labrys sp. KNU-23]
MAQQGCNMTIDQLLNDPLTLALMRADGVDPVSLRMMLTGLARRLAEKRDMPPFLLTFSDTAMPHAGIQGG